jgi:hypothetical protein
MMNTLHPAVIETRCRFSDCGLYRYELHRRIGTEGGPRCVFIMLNPSTAREDRDDPTVRRCVEFSHRWGFSWLTVLNLFAFRSPHPADLLTIHDPIGPENTSTIADICAHPDTTKIVAAWGGSGSALLKKRIKMRAEMIEHLCSSMSKELQAFSLTGEGSPIHPLARGKMRIPDDALTLPLRALREAQRANI